MQSEGELNVIKWPSPTLVERYRKHELVVSKDDLEFKESWNQKAVDQYLRQLFPKAFEWLDTHQGVPKDGEYQWVLVGKDRNRVYVVQKSLITGDEVNYYKGTKGRNYREAWVRIGEHYSVLDIGCGTYLELVQ